MRSKALKSSVAALLICILCAGLARAQTTETQSTDYATPEEERLIEQGHIFYPPKKIRPKKAAAPDKPRYNSEEQRLINEALTLLGLVKKEDISRESVPAPVIEDTGPSQAVTTEPVAPENTAAPASADDPATNSQVESLEEIPSGRVLAEERFEPSPYRPEKTKQVAAQPPTRQISKDETLQIITQSVGPIEITPSSTVTVSASGFELSDGASSQRHLFRYGLQRTSRTSEQWQLYGSYGVALSDYWLVGGAAEYSKNDSDYSLSSELINEDKTLSLLTAWGVQKGSVNLRFQTGSERVELSQRSRLTSFAWRPSALPNLVLNIRNWETIASQDNQLAPVDYVVETPTSYDTYRDARSVALGELSGYSAIGLGIPLGDKLTFSQTFGQERLRFRHSNQKLDEIASAYRSSALQYRDGSTGVELNSQTGVVEKSTSLSFEREGWRVGATRASSKIGLSDYWSVNVGYRKSFEGPNPATARSSVDKPTLMHDLSPREFSYKEALEKISSRPREFPRTLLAKVDAGAVTLISSTPKNRAPMSNAGADQTVSSGAVVTLTGAGSSDPDADQTLTYAWVQTAGTAVTLSNVNAQQPTFIAPILDIGATDVALTFSLTVNDGFATSSADYVDVIVTAPGNNVPTANAGADQAVSSGAVVTLTGAGSSDPDADQTLTYLWAQTDGIAVTLSSNTAKEPTFSAPALNIGDPSMTLTFSLVVNDGLLSSVTSTVNVTVTPPAELITWASSGLIGEYFDYGSPSRSNVSVQLSATSNAGNALTYETTLVSGSLPPGVTLSRTGLISGSASAVAATTDYQFTVRATSSAGIDAISPTLLIKIRQPVLIEWTTAGVSVLKGDAETNALVTTSSFLSPPNLRSAEIVLVAGGGGGGYLHGGGGGGGMVAYASNANVVLAGTINISIGAGGAGAIRVGCSGDTGGDTAFGNIQVEGGGGGGSEGCIGGEGGSAGGTSPGAYTSQPSHSSCGTTIGDFIYRCNSGGGATNSTGYFAGGGGGAGAAGTTSIGSRSASDVTPGNGGAGMLTSDRLGALVLGAGGGGGYSACALEPPGGDESFSAGSGGSGIGGGGRGSSRGGDAVPDTGSGGGGGGEKWQSGCYPESLDTTHSTDHNGGDGSDGLVRLAY